MTQCPQRVENALGSPLHKEVRDISEGQILAAVDNPRYSGIMSQPRPQTTPKHTKDLAPLAGEHSLSLSPSKIKMLEGHIKAFGRSMTFGLPQRVEESLDFYMTKVEPSHPDFQFLVPSHTMAGLDSDQPPDSSKETLEETGWGQRV